MPMYAYLCRQCTHTFDKIAKISERDEVSCESCGSNDLTRVPGNSGGFRLMGSGWAEDGYSNILGNTDSFIKEFGKQKDHD